MNYRIIKIMKIMNKFIKSLSDITCVDVLMNLLMHFCNFSPSLIMHNQNLIVVSISDMFNSETTHKYNSWIYRNDYKISSRKN